MLKRIIQVWAEHFDETKACPLCGAVMQIVFDDWNLYRCPAPGCATRVTKERNAGFKLEIRCRNEAPPSQ